MEGYDKSKGSGYQNKSDIYANAIRAGKRTYFFDVKTTKKDEFYLTITESKKRYDKEGKFTYEKHKIFLYQEDFDNFEEGLADALNFIRNRKEGINLEEEHEEINYNTESDIINGLDAESFSNVEFEDLAE